MAGVSLGALSGKMKSVNVNRIITLGFSLFGLQIGASAAKQAILSLPSSVGANVFPISTANMFRLVDTGTKIASATLLTRFVKNLPFGNYVSPIIGITTAASVIPDILSVVMSLVSGQRQTLYNQPSGDIPRGPIYQSPSAGAVDSAFLTP